MRPPSVSQRAAFTLVLARDIGDLTHVLLVSFPFLGLPLVGLADASD